MRDGFRASRLHQEIVRLAGRGWSLEDGVIHRRTIGDLPPRPRRRGRAWEVQDTDGPAVRTTFDGYIPPAA
ncbi:MAG TPA: hypothetical protein VN107_12190 [Microbacterium sp.]|nr:hypothetical protein [Microbacterium sp.]